MWFMPSYGRPGRLRDMLEAPGGWPETVNVLVNEDDPERVRYTQVLDQLQHEGIRHPFVLWDIPAGSRCSDAHRYITQKWPQEPFYGLLCDDQWPVTPGWDEALIAAAGATGISTPNGEPSFPLLRNALVLGGDLVRAMGTLVPAPVKHNYEDNIWDTIAADLHLLRPLPDVFVEHRHWIRGDAAKDKTYERGSADIDTDRLIFEEWLSSNERAEMAQRIGKLLGSNVSTLDPKSLRVAILVPMGRTQVDCGYHKSLIETMVHFTKLGIPHKIIESTGGSDVGKARERLLWDAMQQYNPTHLMSIDDDMEWTPKQIVRLLCADHEFACIVGARKSDDVKMCANFFEKQEFHERTKFLKIKDVGFAFVLLKVSVIEKMIAAYPELEYNAAPGTREYALFLQMIDEHRERLSEDFSFTNRWRKIGGEIWCDSEASIGHAGRKVYTGKVSDLFEYEKPAKAA